MKHYPKMKQENNNPLLCDPETGMCEMPGANQPESKVTTATEKTIRIVYFTDPICSSCWGIEPQLRKLKSEYGNQLEIEYRMGGLLKDWSYNSGGISKPSDVAHHWDEVSRYYEMPIDGDVWLEDPLSSSYPPSIAFKAAQLQDSEKAIRFLRRIREMVFVEKKNITRWEHLAQAATETGLDAALLKSDYEGKAQQLFQDDLDVAKKYGVRGFPTLFFSNQQGSQLTMYGSKPYAEFENAIMQLSPEIEKMPIDTSWESLFRYFATLTAKEFAMLSGQSVKESERVLNGLTDKKKLLKTETKNGNLWKLNAAGH